MKCQERAESAPNRWADLGNIFQEREYIRLADALKLDSAMSAYDKIVNSPERLSSMWLPSHSLRCLR
jgi:hypothetical protein